MVDIFNHMRQNNLGNLEGLEDETNMILKDIAFPVSNHGGNTPSHPSVATLSNLKEWKEIKQIHLGSTCEGPSPEAQAH